MWAIFCNRVFYRYSNLTPAQLAMENAVILFSVKDKDMFGMSNQYIAECYLPFKDICTNDEEGSREQIHMKLSRPKLTGSLLGLSIHMYRYKYQIHKYAFIPHRHRLYTCLATSSGRQTG